MDTSQYLDMFLDESREHLQACTEHLLELEKNPEDLALVNEVFRAAHTLKGMSATMGYEDIADLTHKMENVLDAIRNEQIVVTTEILDVVFEAVDDLEEMVGDIERGGTGQMDVSSLVETLNRLASGDVAAALDEEEPSGEVSASEDSPYDQFEQTVLLQSIEQGYTVYEVEVTSRDDCVLKAARVFMLFEIFEKVGEVISSNPPAEQLESEEFDTTFRVTLV